MGTIWLIGAIVFLFGSNTYIGYARGGREKMEISDFTLAAFAAIFWPVALVLGLFVTTMFVLPAKIGCNMAKRFQSDGFRALVEHRLREKEEELKALEEGTEDLL